MRTPLAAISDKGEASRPQGPTKGLAEGLCSDFQEGFGQGSFFSKCMRCCPGLRRMEFQNPVDLLIKRVYVGGHVWLSENLVVGGSKGKPN